MCLFYCVSDEDEENQDTVEQILKCIIQNEGDRTHQYFLYIFFNFLLEFGNSKPRTYSNYSYIMVMEMMCRPGV